MKIVAVKPLGIHRVYDLSIDHLDHSFQLSTGVVSHNSAYLISDEPIQNFIPLTTVSGVRVTQYTMKAVEAVGGIKYDFLGLNSGIDLTDALQLIQARHGAPPDELGLNGRRVPGYRLVPLPGGGWADIWDLPDDPAVFADVAAGRTETVFQFNTAGARKWLRHFNHLRADGTPIIRSVMDMAIFTALDRPGPLDAYVTNPEDGSKHNMVVEYARRARGLPSSPDIPAVVSELMPETFGVMVLQEQLQYSYQKLTGCTGPEAEAFRRLIAKKEMEKILKQFDSFVERAAPHLGGPENAKKVWDMYATFGQYGFNLAHSLCYSLIGYATAYLKHHYPLEWWCAVLRNAKKEEIAEEFWQHCAPLVLMPDVERSGKSFEIEGDRIRAPLWLVDGVGEAAHSELVAGKPYRDIRDFCDRIYQHKLRGATQKAAYVDAKGKAKPERTVLGHSSLHRGVVFKLILAGVLDSLFPAGTSLYDKLAAYEVALADAASAATGKKEKPDPVPLSFLSLDALGRYQLIKTILPVYSGRLRQHLPESLTMHAFGGRLCLRRERNPAELVDAPELATLEVADFEGPITVAAPVYLQSVETFTYQDNTKRAWKLHADLEGGRRELVYWGSKKDGSDLQAGQIAVLVLSRTKADRGFSVVDWVVVRAPLRDEDLEDKEPAGPRVYGADKDPPADAVDIMRPGPLGNPFSHLADSTAIFRTKTVEEAVRKYEEWLPQQEELRPLVAALAGRSLKCKCPPKRGWDADALGGYRCHGQVLLRAANGDKLRGWNIYSRSLDGRGVAAALTNPTTMSYSHGTISKQYPVVYRGIQYLDAEAAYEDQAQNIAAESERDLIMIDIIRAKFLQHPDLVEAVRRAGGAAFLRRCTHLTSARTDRYKRWEGIGMQSRFIRNLVAGYEALVTVGDLAS